MRWRQFNIGRQFGRPRASLDCADASPIGVTSADQQPLTAAARRVMPWAPLTALQPKYGD